MLTVVQSPEVMRGYGLAEELSLSSFTFATATPATRGRDPDNRQLESRKRRKTSDATPQDFSLTCQDEAPGGTLPVLNLLSTSNLHRLCDLRI